MRAASTHALAAVAHPDAQVEFQMHSAHAASTAAESDAAEVVAAVSEEALAFSPSAAAVHAASSPSAPSVPSSLPPAYASYLRGLVEACPDLPRISIEFHELSYTLELPLQQHSIPTLAAAVPRFATSVAAACRRSLFGSGSSAGGSERTLRLEALQPCTGSIPAGSMTLLLAPPGHGKSTLLKALAGRLSTDPRLGGTLKWNGMTRAQAESQGMELQRVCSFVEQLEAPFPTLTVAETIAFATECSTAPLHLLPPAHRPVPNFDLARGILALTGLTECGQTLVGGSAGVRGVSGGQRRRVALAEALASQPRVLLLDEISTGLDAATTVDLVRALGEWARITGGTVLMALLQPSPCVLECFDRLWLVREGATLFHGPRDQLIPHLHSMHIRPSEEQELAEWIVDFLADPLGTQLAERTKVERHRKFLARRKSSSGLGGAPPLPLQAPHVLAVDGAPPREASRGSHSVSRVRFHIEPDLPQLSQNGRRVRSSDDAFAAPVLPQQPLVDLSTAALRDAFERRRLLYPDAFPTTTSSGAPSTAAAPRTPYVQSQFYSRFSHSPFRFIGLLLARQARILFRSRSILLPRLLKDFGYGAVAGSLYWQRGEEDYASRVALAFIGSSALSFSNMSEVPLACQAMRVVQAQVDQRFYSPALYIFAQAMMHLPLSLMETLCFSIPCYFLSGFTVSAGNFFFFALVLLVFNEVMSALFKCIAYASGRADVGQVLVEPAVTVLQAASGFLITASYIPNFAKWIYWISPFSWSIRSIAQNEFFSARYDEVLEGGERMGNTFLRVVEISTDRAFQWAGVGYLAALWIVLSALAVYLISGERTWLAMGTKRAGKKHSNSSAAGKNDAPPIALEAVALSIPPSPSTVHTIPVQRLTLSWHNVNYSVKLITGVVSKLGTKRKQLLTSVDGLCVASSLTALMGSSGAGKTTLLDVLSRRATAGTTTGDIRVNGVSITELGDRFSKLVGYVEQSDVHCPTDTVHEALLFAARMRLPASMSDAQRDAYVLETMQLLELLSLRARLVSSLSPGQLKRLSIAVELVAAPEILFLDEPCSGLDSRAAIHVMRVVKRVSATGRAVLVTIHQPSPALFSFFDRLILLHRGGSTVFNGDLGVEAVNVVNHFETLSLPPGIPRPILPARTNVASWMLELIGAGTGAGEEVSPWREVDFAAAYAGSELRARNEAESAAVLRECAAKKEVQQKLLNNTATTVQSSSSLYARSSLYQLSLLLRRLFVSYWRDLGYNVTRFFVLLASAIVAGLLWLQLEAKDQAGANSKLAALYFSFYYVSLFQSAAMLPVIYRWKAVWLHEHAVHTYRLELLSVAFGLVELPYIAAQTLLFAVPFYFLCGFRAEAGVFWLYVLLLFLVSLVLSFAGQAWAALIEQQSMAKIPQCFMFDVMFLFG